MGKCQRSNCTRFERWVLGAKGRSGETFLCAFLDLYWAVPGLREVENCFCCRSNYSSWVLPVSRQDGGREGHKEDEAVSLPCLFWWGRNRRLSSTRLRKCP